MVTELKDEVYWVGVVDWDLREFHGHELSTHRGSTYNAYLIRDEKNVLVDTVWQPFSDRLIENIREVMDPAKIDIVVANHAEMDHAGSLPAVMREVGEAELVVSEHGRENIDGHFHRAWPYRTVGTGDRIDIGSREMAFIEAPMLHWPDSMFTYLSQSNILMPNDAFGQHYATIRRHNDQVDQDELWQEALKYYVNILTPFSAQVLKKIEELLGLGLPVDVIAPSHGVIWREEPLQIVEKYREWARQEPEQRVAIVYDTMWGATRRMAEAIAEGLAERGVPSRLLNMSLTDRNDALVEVFRAGTVLVGSPTFNNGVLPTIAPILEDLRGLRFKNKRGAAFGSYGWSGQATGIIEEHLENSKIEVAAEGIRCKWQPDECALEQCRGFGQRVAEATVKPSS